eukprot:CAMPEP_0171129800 /NCGR_PEP_ID=MMETSP0766_2-20121228/119658_1 /TAXON_ID=439317 /ORGANISM="Gambierdiscus australes, Strain CAWD 149" /LENGTH=51 /DNA_ID=CAMNT_0011593019 /DNA_START=74 /DNA_END=226 /DNA_ORIENTATION=-
MPSGPHPGSKSQAANCGGITPDINGTGGGTGGNGSHDACNCFDALTEACGD